MFDPHYFAQLGLFSALVVLDAYMNTVDAMASFYGLQPPPRRVAYTVQHGLGGRSIITPEVEAWARR